MNRDHWAYTDFARRQQRERAGWRNPMHRDASTIRTHVMAWTFFMAALAFAVYALGHR